MIAFFYGTDTFRSKKKLIEFKKEFIKRRDDKGFNIVNFEGQKIDLEKLRKSILSDGLFSEKRLIIIKNIFYLGDKELSDQEKQIFKEIINCLKKIKEKNNNIIVFWDEKIEEKKLNVWQKKIFKILTKEKYAQEFKLLKKLDLEKWIQEKVKIEKVKIEKRAISSLINKYGSNLWLLNNELEKLIALKKNSSDKIITLNDIIENLFPLLEENIWLLTDALGQKDKSTAIKILSDLIKQNIGIDKIVPVLAHQYRTLLRIKSYSQNNPQKNYYQISQEISVHPYACKKALSQIKKYSLLELKKIYQSLLRIDLLRKTKKIDSQVLINLLIVKS